MMKNDFLLSMLSSTLATLLQVVRVLRQMARLGKKRIQVQQLALLDLVLDY